MPSLPRAALASPAALIDELVDANHILYHQGIVDAFGHISARDPRHPGVFWMARNLAPGSVNAADILAFDVQTGEPLQADPPRVYLERFIHSELYRARPDAMAVVHNHSPAVLPFTIARGARLRPVCHMAGFLGGEGAACFEIRDVAGEGSDLLIRDRRLGQALAERFGPDGRVVLMRGHGCTVLAPSVPVAVFRSVYTELNARLQAQAAALGEPDFLTAAEADATRETNEGQVQRPWALWREQARDAQSARAARAAATGPGSSGAG